MDLRWYSQHRIPMLRLRERTRVDQLHNLCQAQLLH